MRNTKQLPAPAARGYREEPMFEVFDVVAIGEPWPAADLECGAWGTVLSVLAGHDYEVEFTDRDGNPLTVTTVPERLLCLVWADSEA